VRYVTAILASHTNLSLLVATTTALKSSVNIKNMHMNATTSENVAYGHILFEEKIVPVINVIVDTILKGICIVRRVFVFRHQETFLSSLHTILPQRETIPNIGFLFVIIAYLDHSVLRATAFL